MSHDESSDDESSDNESSERTVSEERESTSLSRNNERKKNNDHDNKMYVYHSFCSCKNETITSLQPNLVFITN